MFRGVIISESLKNPTVLNDMNVKKVRVETDNENEAPIWHLFHVELYDALIDSVPEIIANELKPHWYAHFWNESFVYICFSGKVFKTTKGNLVSKTGNYPQIIEYAKNTAHVEEKYLNFKMEDLE